MLKGVIVTRMGPRQKKKNRLMLRKSVVVRALLNNSIPISVH